MVQSVTGCIYQPCGDNQEFKLMLTLSDYVCHDVSLVEKPFFLLALQMVNTVWKTQASNKAIWGHSFVIPAPWGLSIKAKHKM